MDADGRKAMAIFQITSGSCEITNCQWKNIIGEGLYYTIAKHRNPILVLIV